MVATATLIVALPVLCEDERTRLIVPLDRSVSDPDESQGQMPKSFSQATGYEPRAQDRRSKRGKALYDRFNCAQCHAVESQGGEVGPPLDGIGGHRGRDWMIARLLDPAQQMKEFPEIYGGKPNIMPHPGVSKKQAELLADFLLTLPEPKAGFAVTHHQIPKGSAISPSITEWQPKSESEASRNGKELFLKLRCSACHSIDGSKDRFGPDLAGIGSRLSAERLDKILSGAIRSSVMKEQTKALGEERIFDLRAFLLTLPKAGTESDRESKQPRHN